MRHRTNTSIGQKITTLVMATSTVVLLLFLFSAALIQTAHFRSTINDKLFTLGHIIALNSKQALTFKQKWEVQKIIETLAVEPAIEVASVFDSNNEVIAHYLNREQSSFAAELRDPGFRRDLLLRAMNSGEEVSAQTFSHITVYVPVFHAGEYLGSIFIQTNTNALVFNLLWFLLAALLILGVALLIAYMLAPRLQKQITEPLHTLTHSMSSIVQGGKYSSYTELPPAQISEINTLIGNFTAMLHQISEQEHALQNYSTDLEQQVKERTSALEHSNRRLEQSITELNRAKDEAIMANAAKSRFLANIGHEIRTPMIGVLGMAELLEKHPLPPEQMELVNTIYNSGSALLTLLNDLLDISKIEAGKLELHIAPFSPADTIDIAVEVLAESAFSKGLDITVVIDPAIPVELSGDASRLRQIVLNLVSNAIKFTHYGTIVVEVHPTEVSEDSCTLHLEVRDTGIGISPEIKTRIFEAFTQADSSTSREYGGTGLGLTIIKQLCELMRGRINVSDNKPHGTVFSLDIPFEIRAGSTPLEAQWLAGDAELRSFASIVIISPHKALAEAIKYHLTPLGKSPVVVGNPELIRPAIANLPNKKEPVLVYLDNALPAECVKLAQEIKNTHSANNAATHALTIACIATHQWILQHSREKGSAIDLFLPKPLKARSLREQTTSRITPAPERPAPTAALAQKQEDKPAPTQDKATLEDEKTPHLRGNILVAEDQYTNQRLVQLLLDQAGFTLTTVDNGHDVLNIMQQQSFDLILMDCQMPGMDGYEATRELRRRNIHIPIIAMTAHVCDEDIQRCSEAGMDDFLRKPFKNSQLVEMVRKHLPSSQHGEGE
ncbi:MAG: response regulator [Geobacteraceae bacterium]|nr:response regulator [Geobacteraceae bacterium]